MTTQPVISVHNLTRKYGTYTAVDGISFSIYPGEVFALLGTNGAGKTSTLEILEGLARPSSGDVRVWGLDPFRKRNLIRPRQGVMMQNGGFPTDLTVIETVRMWANTLSRPLPVGDVLERVGLSHRATVRVSALSGGEVRRLDLACAIVGQPELLFLDEPTTGLDPTSREQTWQLFAEINQSGTTLVLTTHYLEEAEHLSDRIAIMDRGTIARHGTLTDLIAHYPAKIRCRPSHRLPDVMMRVATKEHEYFSWQTTSPQEDLTELLRWASHNDVTLQDLSVQPATLSAVFHDIATTPTSV